MSRLFFVQRSNTDTMLRNTICIQRMSTTIRMMSYALCGIAIFSLANSIILILTCMFNYWKIAKFCLITVSVSLTVILIIFIMVVIIGFIRDYYMKFSTAVFIES